MRCSTCHRRVVERCPLHPANATRAEGTPAPALPIVPGHMALGVLGQGGFGRVYLARREADGHTVALKVLERHSLDRLGREREALRRIGPPAVPALLGECATAAGEPILVMEAIAGVTLAHHLATQPGSGALPWSRAQALMVGMAEALVRVHDARIVHRDLKPENVMLAGPRVVLLDFGLARPEDTLDQPAPAPTVTLTGQRLGTPEYMAPEQCQDARRIDTRADLYSLGVVFFEMLSGRPPFVGNASAVLQAQVALRPPPLAGDVPSAVTALVQRLLAKAPEARFADARALVEALRAVPALAEVSVQAFEKPTVLQARCSVRDVALLGVRTRLSPASVFAPLLPLGAVMGRMDPGQVIVAFPHAPTVERGLHFARKAAEALTPLLPEGSRIALHCAPLRVRERGDRVTLAGAALEHPGRWWPVSAEAGLVPRTPEALSHSGTWGDTPRAPVAELAPPCSELEGRDADLDWLRAGLSRARETGAPVLLTLLGSEGLGKTRLLAEWHRELEQLPGVQSLRIEPSRSEGASDDSGPRELVAAVLGLPPDTSHAEAVRALLAPETPPSASGTTHPAAHRQHIARAVAEHLGRLAAQGPRVVLVDDAHLLDPIALDALELATLATAHAPLCVVLAGQPGLLGLRPYLGERARDSARRVLAPLDDEAARTVLRQLLRPVELVPEGLLRTLGERCGGSPLRMAETVRSLRAAGALRSQTDGQGWYLATDAMHGLATDSPDERLAERGLATLPSGLRALLFVAALLGDEVRLDEVTATLARLEPSCGLDLSHDPGVGLGRLARAGLLSARGPGRWRFEHPSLREAFAALLPAPLVHRVCEAALAALPDAPTPRRARLAEAAGDVDHALALHSLLAESARREHRLLDAERHYTAALDLLTRGESPVRRLLLSGRGRVRYRLQRIDDAVADLRAARALAETQGDVLLAVDLMLEEATALDWQDDTEGSTALLERALGRLEKTAPPELAARQELARARVIVRRGDAAAAVPALERAARLARDAGETEAEVISLAMLGAMLAWTERREESEQRFNEAIARCEATGDLLHLGVALNNRVVLRVAQRDVAGACSDLERAVALGREWGNVQIERTSAFNLAELLLYQGRTTEALPLARRAGQLSQRFFPHSMAQDGLLLARLSLAVGDLDGTARQLAWLEETGAARRLPLGSRVLQHAVMRGLGEAQGAHAYDGAQWARLSAEAQEHCTPDERLEVLVAAAEAARAAQDAPRLRSILDEANAAIRIAPLWTERVRELSRSHSDRTEATA
ncbi:protein kinase [Myxococcaceae bacterium JPH2]|nr:protein kinase [Myxococcaceae bacterium JPH2]